MTLQLIAALLIGYAFGSVPFGLLIAKLGGAGDVRSIGSGNIGATNVLRTGRKGLAAATLLADALKGAVPIWLFASWGAPAILFIGLGAFLGHLFPVWLGFKGGKGIATYVGLLLALAWWQGFVAFALTWLIAAAIFRYSSLAALLATLVAPGVIWWQGETSVAYLFFALTALAWFMHRANISRLLNGSEGKIGAKG